MYSQILFGVIINNSVAILLIAYPDCAAMEITKKKFLKMQSLLSGNSMHQSNELQD